MGGTQADVSRWTGASGDEDWATAGNWATHAGSPTTTIPSDGESALFDERSATGVSATLDQSGIELSGLACNPGFRFELGTDAAPLLIDVDHTNSGAVTPYCSIYGMGRFVKLSGSIINANVAHRGAGKFYLSGGTITNPVFSAGTSVIESAGLIAPASGSGVAVVQGGNITVRQHAGSTTSDIATFYIFGGEANNYRTSNQLLMGGGSPVVRLLFDAAVDTRIDQIGGTLYMNSSGTIALLNGYAGVATTKGATQDFTISAQNLYLAKHTMDITASPIVVTETASAVKYGFSGLGA